MRTIHPRNFQVAGSRSPCCACTAAVNGPGCLQLFGPQSSDEGKKHVKSTEDKIHGINDRISSLNLYKIHRNIFLSDLLREIAGCRQGYMMYYITLFALYKRAYINLKTYSSSTIATVDFFCPPAPFLPTSPRPRANIQVCYCFGH